MKQNHQILIQDNDFKNSVCRFNEKTLAAIPMDLVSPLFPNEMIS